MTSIRACRAAVVDDYSGKGCAKDCSEVQQPLVVLDHTTTLSPLILGTSAKVIDRADLVP
jgi:hypothetical protein